MGVSLNGKKSGQSQKESSLQSNDSPPSCDIFGETTIHNLLHIKKAMQIKYSLVFWYPGSH